MTLIDLPQEINLIEMAWPSRDWYEFYKDDASTQCILVIMGTDLSRNQNNDVALAWFRLSTAIYSNVSNVIPNANRRIVWSSGIFSSQD